MAMMKLMVDTMAKVSGLKIPVTLFSIEFGHILLHF